jgi:hypothetical protein
MTTEQKITLLDLMRKYTHDAMDFATTYKDFDGMPPRHDADDSLKALLDYVEAL